MRGVVVGFTAATALLRRECDGYWTAGFGARIDVAPFAVGDSFRNDGTCVEAGHAELSGAVVGVANNTSFKYANPVLNV